jgi:hypothetical protein
MRSWFQIPTVLLASLLTVNGCGRGSDESVEEIQNALETETGGYDTADELPAFGMAELDEVALEAVPVVPEQDGLEAYTGVPATSTATSPCPRGYLKGTWKEVAKGYGLFHGKWADSSGTVKGHLKGLYGRNAKNVGVFFGKYIDLDGKFVGLIKGHYGKGFLKGLWHDKSGIRGALLGVYGGTPKNLFVGKWVEFCSTCATGLTCATGFELDPIVKCFCVPKGVAPCKAGGCASSEYCDPCPAPAGCLAETDCSAVCAPPACVAKPATTSAAPVN